MAIYKRVVHRLKSDSSLLQSFARGDVSAFEVLYDRYKDLMFNYLCNQTDRRDAAEEIAQEVWTAVISGAANFEDKSSFRSWLFSIAYRRIADHWRAHYRQQNELDTDAAMENVAIEGQQESERMHDELRNGLNHLPDEQRQSFLLREQGFSYEEIAEITEAGVETVKSRLRYAKAALQKHFGEIHA